ncbi:MAG: copper amine oxidase N-terminal domain-containing protein, partial [Eubacterium sp.]|nr:copper amine oxidase N-terminal domain-containing protein [Eubacterium sp.]
MKLHVKSVFIQMKKAGLRTLLTAFTITGIMCPALVFAADASELAVSYVSSNYTTSNIQEGSSFTVMLNGVDVTDSFSNTVKVTTDGRTLIPLRDLGNILGADVDWDSRKVAILTKDSVTIEVPIGSTVLFINGQQENIDAEGTQAVIADSYTYLPLRAVSEALGAAVEYEAGTKTIYLTTDGTATPSTELKTNAPEKTAEQLAFDQEYPTGAVLGYDANNGPNPGEAYYTSWYKYTSMAKAAGLTDEQINYNLQYIHLNPYNNDSVIATTEQAQYYDDVIQNAPNSYMPSWSGTFKGEMYECWQWSGVDWGYAGESYAGLT